jgi:hypothetical protein
MADAEFVADIALATEEGIVRRQRLAKQGPPHLK